MEEAKKKEIVKKLLNERRKVKCPFCNIESLKMRIFYRNYNLIAFLAVPYHTKGHTILAPLRYGTDCPNKLEKLKPQIWDRVGTTLKDVSKALMECYKPKDILFSSLRGDIKHFHFHLIPLWELEEKIWRQEKGYERGHLLEFLGYLENKGYNESLKQRMERGCTEEEQRKEITNTLIDDVKKLRYITGYV